MSSAARVAPDEPGYNRRSSGAPAISPRDAPASVPPPVAERPSKGDLRHSDSGQRRASEEQIVPAPVARQRSRAEDYRQRDARTEDQKNIDRLIELATQQRQARTSRAARQRVLPEWLAGRDARTIGDPAKRELVSFALRDEPSERPTAGALLAKTLELAGGIEGGAPSNAVRVGDGRAYTEQKE